MNALVDPVVFYVVFLFSVTLHEAAHAATAKLGGDLTAYHGGQVTIDPIPHIRREPFGMVVLPLITVFISGWPFGFASAPYDPQWAARHPRRAAWMSLAGPAANLALVLLAALVIRVGMAADAFVAPQSVFFSQITVAPEAGLVGAAAFVLSVTFSLNLVLFLLNLFPVPPLDGSGALPLLLPDSLIEPYRNFTQQPMLGFVGILIAWRLFDAVWDPAFLFAVNGLYPGSGYH